MLAKARAHLRGRFLDRELSRGADPASSEELAQRAAWLTSRRRRRSLARSLRHVRELGTRHPPGPSAAIPPDLKELSGARLQVARVESLLELVDEPVYSRGVAMVEVLITDGLSPLYYPRRSGQLREALEEIIDALEGR